ncbi:hypothetical protein ACA910_016550 [Epithemia clementina (nom. ined.)]
MLNGILYKSSMLVWKEKVKQDAICPPTYIHQKLGDETVFSYQGPSEATAGELPADQWQPYIHVMPHTEFPSGSSCLYTAFACVMQLVYGDNIVADIGWNLTIVRQQGSYAYYKTGAPVHGPGIQLFKLVANCATMR